MLRVLELFAGIGTASQALADLGVDFQSYAVEIDATARRVPGLSQNYGAQRRCRRSASG